VASARRLLVAGLVLLVPVALGFHLRVGLRLADAFLSSALVVTLPLLALAQLPLLRHGLPERVEVYASSALTLGMLTFLALVAGATGPGMAAMGLGPADPVEVLGVAGVLFVACLLLTALTLRLDDWIGGVDVALMRRLIPRTSREKVLFGGVSVVAGVGEEIVYRGYLVTVLAGVMGDPWVALLVSSLAFGLLHGYQGGGGIVRTALLGGVLGAGFVVTGSLWSAIVAHTAVDLVGGLVLGPKVYPEAPPG
jgi:membrane protease YdiL (CAAX protease family)